MPLFGPPNVENLKAKGDVPALIKALGYEKDQAVRKAAAKALGQIGDARAIEPLIAALKGHIGEVQKAAASSLAMIRDARAVEPLIAVLKDLDRDVRKAAAEALGLIRDARAVEPLITTLKDEDRSVRKAAAGALETFAWQPEMTETGAVYWIARDQWQNCVDIGAAAVKPLIATLTDRTLTDRDWAVRQGVAEVLGRIGAPAVEPLIAAFKDRAENTRQAINQVVMMSGMPDVAKAVALREWNLAVFKSLVDSLGQIRDEHVVEFFVPALRDHDKNVREAATRVLDRIGWEPDRTEAGAAYWAAKGRWEKCVEIGAPAVASLIDRVDSGNNDNVVRMGAAESLGKIGDTRAVEPLIYILRFSSNMPADKTEREVAAKALVRIGAPAVEALIAALKDRSYNYKVFFAAVGALVEISAPAVEPLIAALNDQNTDVREGAVDALGQIGDARAIEPLIAALKDSNDDVRKAAAGALNKLGWQSG
jgi:HEAT repeat protein